MPNAHGSNGLPESIEPDWAERVRSWAASEPLILEAYFFGSRAKGKHRDDSDLDIAVKVGGKDQGEALANAIFETARWQVALAALLPVTVDLQSMSPDDVVVTPAVHDHGVLVYAKAGDQRRATTAISTPPPHW